MKLVRASVLVAIHAALLVGCANTQLREALAARLAGAPPDAPLPCVGECKTEWQRAQLWLAKHSRWKLQATTDVILQTYNPINHEPSYGFSVAREPSADGYTITMSLGCGNAFGCDPLPTDVRRAFYQYVSTGTDVLVGMPYMSALR